MCSQLIECSCNVAIVLILQCLIILCLTLFRGDRHNFLAILKVLDTFDDDLVTRIQTTCYNLHHPIMQIGNLHLCIFQRIIRL